ncbi:MAG: hypothetical protein C4554_01445 [Dethiobacter sp.]|nr:MAG: hypothetical protein C4554_01445 [Dethiobacter sp.]
MYALWLNKFDFSGNTEAVITWTKGVLEKGLKVHLVLIGVPSPLLGIYQEHLNKAGLKSSLNINRQQVQNLLYYRSFDLLHVYHPDLFNMAGELGSTFKIPWLASVFEGERHENFSFLHKASYITCCNSVSLQVLKGFFYPYNKQNLLLIPQGVTIKPANFSSLEQMSILYAGPLEISHAASFQALNGTVPSLKPCTFGLVSRHKPSTFKRKFYPWTPDLSNIVEGYNIIAGFGYFLLQGISAGKIALILEEKYGGIFSPFHRKQVPDFRAKSQGEDDMAVHKLLSRDLQALLDHLPAAKKLRQDNWSYARENHDLEIIAEKIIRLYSRIL